MTKQEKFTKMIHLSTLSLTKISNQEENVQTSHIHCTITAKNKYQK